MRPHGPAGLELGDQGRAAPTTPGGRRRAWSMVGRVEDPGPDPWPPPSAESEEQESSRSSERDDPDPIEKKEG
jgi:hypothetical protein